MARSSLHDKLAEEFGGQAAIALRDSLTRIAAAMKGGQGSASFTVTAQFSSKRDGSLVLDVKPRERIPLTPTRFAVKLHGEQLALGGVLAEAEEAPAKEDD